MGLGWLFFLLTLPAEPAPVLPVPGQQDEVVHEQDRAVEHHGLAGAEHARVVLVEPALLEVGARRDPAHVEAEVEPVRDAEVGTVAGQARQRGFLRVAPHGAHEAGDADGEVVGTNVGVVVGIVFLK